MKSRRMTAQSLPTTRRQKTWVSLGLRTCGALNPARRDDPLDPQQLTTSRTTPATRATILSAISDNDEIIEKGVGQQKNEVKLAYRVTPV